MFVKLFCNSEFQLLILVATEYGSVEAFVYIKTSLLAIKIILAPKSFSKTPLTRVIVLFIAANAKALVPPK